MRLIFFSDCQQRPHSRCRATTQGCHQRGLGQGASRKSLRQVLPGEYLNKYWMTCRTFWNQCRLGASVLYLVMTHNIFDCFLRNWLKKIFFETIWTFFFSFLFRRTSVTCRRGKKLEDSWLWIWEEPTSGFSWSTSVRTRSSTWSRKFSPSPTKSWQGKF